MKTLLAVALAGLMLGCPRPCRADEPDRALVDDVRKAFGASPASLVVFVDLRPDRPYADIFRVSGNFWLDNVFRRNIRKRVGGTVTDPALIDALPDRPLLFIVQPSGGIAPADVKFWAAEVPLVNSKVVGDYACYYDATPRPSTIRYVFGTEAKKQFAIGFPEAPAADFTTEFGAFFITRSQKKPGFGLAKGLFTLGRSQTLTLDAVTLFGSTPEEDAAIGGALTYSTLIGSRRLEGYRGIFGFPLKISVTLGLEGLDLTRVSGGGGKAFVGFGLAIPTSSR